MTDQEAGITHNPSEVSPSELAAFLSRGEVHVRGGLRTHINPEGEQEVVVKLGREGGVFLDVSYNAYLGAVGVFTDTIGQGKKIEGVTDSEVFSRNFGDVNFRVDNLVQDSLDSWVGHVV